MFDGTILENVSAGCRERINEDISDALYAAGVSEFVENLPDGIETRIGRAGASLSTGQAQRVCLARALAGRPNILILDESSSALDEMLERRILMAVRQYIPLSLIIIVSHRPDSVPNPDIWIEVTQEGVTLEHFTGKGVSHD